jgi:hypothetical protein
MNKKQMIYNILLFVGMVCVYMVGAPWFLAFFPLLIFFGFVTLFIGVFSFHYLIGQQITISRHGKRIGILQRGVGYIRLNEHRKNV